MTGRRVLTREVGALGRGKHLLELSSGRPLAAGVYLVHLEQGGRKETARISVVR